jgi:hypothetical protein
MRTNLSRAQLVSRNRNPFKAAILAKRLRVTNAILYGELIYA